MKKRYYMKNPGLKILGMFFLGIGLICSGAQAAERRDSKEISSNPSVNFALNDSTIVVFKLRPDAKPTEPEPKTDRSQSDSVAFTEENDQQQIAEGGWNHEDSALVPAQSLAIEAVRVYTEEECELDGLRQQLLQIFNDKTKSLLIEISLRGLPPESLQCLGFDSSN